MRLPAEWKKQISKVTRLFQQVDRSIQVFKTQSGIDCLPRCGNCCAGKEIEATVLEFLPLAAALWQNGQADYWLEQLQQTDDDSSCVFLAPDLQTNGGFCWIYPLRGLICRLFGFSTNRDKQGNPRLITCKAIKQTLSPALSALDTAPDMTALYAALASLSPELGSTRYPINQAIRRALETTGFIMEMNDRYLTFFRRLFKGLFRRK